MSDQPTQEGDDGRTEYEKSLENEGGTGIEDSGEDALDARIKEVDEELGEPTGTTQPEWVVAQGLGVPGQSGTEGVPPEQPLQVGEPSGEPGEDLASLTNDELRQRLDEKNQEREDAGLQTIEAGSHATKADLISALTTQTNPVDTEETQA